MTRRQSPESWQKKKIELAAAEFHHASVKEKQALEKKKVSDEENESDITKEKIASVALRRIHKNIKAHEEQLEKLTSQNSEALIHLEEAKATVETVSSKKKKAAKAKAAVADAKLKAFGAKLIKTKTKLDKEEYKKVGAESDLNAARDAENKSRLTNVAVRVKYEAAKHARLHAQFMRLKAKNLSKLAAAKLAKEVAKKAKRHAKNDIKGAKEMLKVMASGPGAKEAAKSVKRAEKRYGKNKTLFVAANKKVDKVKNKVNANEVKWASKMAYKAVMKTAVVGAAALKADKAFASALSDADKRAKKLTASQAHKELKLVTAKAETASANLAHVKFAASQDKKARIEVFKEEMKKDKKKKAKKKARKAEAKMAKAALSGVGKAPGKSP